MSDVSTFLALADAMGIDRKDIATAVGSAQAQAKARVTFAPGVHVLEGDEAKKFGDVSVTKTKNGRSTNKLGVFKEDLPQFISDLQAANEILNG